MVQVEHIFSKSLLAGIAIGVGGFIFLSCANKFIGAFLFAVGLASCVVFKLNLITGKSGFASDKNDLKRYY